MAAPKKTNNNIGSISAATGGSIQRGNAETKKMEVTDKSNPEQAAPPPPIPSYEHDEEIVVRVRTPGLLSDKMPETEVQNPQEENELTEEEKMKKGFAKASPRFQELHEKAEASETERQESLEKNKIDEVPPENDVDATA